MNLLKRAREFNRKIQQMSMYNGGEIVKKATGGELTVEQMYEYDKLFPTWEMGTFAVDDIRNHDGILYRCIQAHTSTGDPSHTPDVTPALWVVMRLEPEGDAILEWVAGEVVETGVLRMHDDIIYECVQGHTTQAGWEPPKLPALWSVVENASGGGDEDPEESETPIAYPEYETGKVYKVGDRITYKGKVWESIYYPNSWSPDGYPQGWELIA